MPNNPEEKLEGQEQLNHHATRLTNFYATSVNEGGL